MVCLWEYKTACVVHELDCRTCDESTSIDRTGEGNSCVVVRACCNANYIVALLRDNTVHVWNRNDGYLSNIIEMVHINPMCMYKEDPKIIQVTLCSSLIHRDSTHMM